MDNAATLFFYRFNRRNNLQTTFVLTYCVGSVKWVELRILF